MLEGKSILLLSVKFFNYENLIGEELRKMGASVDIYDERPSNSFFSKVIIRLRKDFYNGVIKTYYRRLIEQVGKKSYDYFLLIKGEAVPHYFIEFLRENNPGIRMIYYTYDSFRNNKNGLDNLKLFDESYTFDKQDASAYGIKFRPLFFADEYASLYEDRRLIKYDISFVGTAHSDRYVISERLHDWCIKSNKSMFAFYYSPSKFLFYINRVIKKSFKGFSLEKISFRSLSHKDIIEIYRSSCAILDINHPGQDGLTMRTFETLGAGRKLLTTNPNIKNYPFYHPQNITIIKRDVLQIDSDFFNTDFVPIAPALYQKMGIKGWIDDVFGITDVTYWNDEVAK